MQPHSHTYWQCYQPVSMQTPFLTNLNPQSKEIQLHSPSRELCLSTCWSLSWYQLQVQGSLPITIARLRQRRERPVLIPAMVQLGAVGKVIRACPRNWCSSRDENHEVGLCSSCKASETPKAKRSYSMISRDLDSSYTHPVPWSLHHDTELATLQHHGIIYITLWPSCYTYSLKPWI